MSTPVRVIKIGGSVLSRPDAYERIGSLLGRASDHHQVLLAGGGEPVDWLRRLDQIKPLGDEAAHWAAVAMMDVNTRAIAGWWPGETATDDWVMLQGRLPSPGRTFFAAGRFLHETEPRLPGGRLPIGWQVTSDSIAARLAELLEANLTLVKSCERATPDSQEGWRRLADEGVVDAFFPSIVGSVSGVELSSIEKKVP